MTVTGGELNVLLRGVSRTNAVLLYLAGGPRGSEFGAMRRHRAELEQDFVVATLDQRGAGSSYDQLEPLVTHSLANAVTDVIEASDYCAPGLPNSRCTCGAVVGKHHRRAGSQAAPELFAAFVGDGQMVDVTETDQIFYHDTLAWARQRGDAEFVTANLPAVSNAR